MENRVDTETAVGNYGMSRRLIISDLSSYLIFEAWLPFLNAELNSRDICISFHPVIVVLTVVARALVC